MSHPSEFRDNSEFAQHYPNGAPVEETPTRTFEGLTGPVNLTFKKYMRLVDLMISRKVGLSHLDLPDWDYYSAWSDEVPPREAAQMALENACDDMGMDYDNIFGDED